jgi:hypothetical protein
MFMDCESYEEIVIEFQKSWSHVGRFPWSSCLIILGLCSLLLLWYYCYRFSNHRKSLSETGGFNIAKMLTKTSSFKESFHIPT